MLNRSFIAHNTNVKPIVTCHLRNNFPIEITRSDYWGWQKLRSGLLQLAGRDCGTNISQVNFTPQLSQRKHA